MRVILQTTQSDCLITCAAMIMEKFRCKIPVYRLLEKIQNSICGSNVLQLRETMTEYGFNVNGYKVELNKLSNKVLPLIAYVNGNHFVVLEKIKKSKIYVIDPAIGKITYNNQEFEKIYSGVVICLSPNKSGVEKVNYKESTLSLLKDTRIIKILCGLFLSSIFTQFIAVSYSYMYSLVSQDNSVGKLVCLVCAVVVILGISSLLKGRLMKKFNLIYEKIYGNVMTDRLVNKNYKFFSIRNNGDLLYRVNARGAIKESVLMKIVPAIISSCTVIVVLFLLYKNKSVMGLMLALFSIIYVLLLVLTGLKSYGLSNAYTQKLISLNTTTENIVRSIATIKVLDVSEQFVKQWKDENLIQTKSYGKLITIQSFQEIISNIYTYLIPIVVNVIGIMTTQHTGFQEMALLPLLYLVVQNVSVLGMAFVSVYTVAPTINKTNELLDEDFMKEKKPQKKKLSNNCIIEMDNLSYYYGPQLCFKDVNAKIKKGEKIAVLGLSGSGKSTFLKIIANLLCDYRGEIFFADTCREKPVYLDQETCIIDGTILENVAFGQKIDLKKLMKVAQITGLDKIVNQQPQGWSTRISKGKNLSKGQEQRVCLARCLLKESDIYLLDEATSNIDVLDEEVIINNLFCEYEDIANKNIFISTHKLNIINYVDRVVYVSDNKIYFGTHSDLMKRVMSYKELMQH